MRIRQRPPVEILNEQCISIFTVSNAPYKVTSIFTVSNHYIQDFWNIYASPQHRLRRCTPFLLLLLLPLLLLLLFQLEVLRLAVSVSVSVSLSLFLSLSGASSSPRTQSVSVSLLGARPFRPHAAPLILRTPLHSHERVDEHAAGLFHVVPVRI
jgi:hypothetical protein